MCAVFAREFPPENVEQGKTNGWSRVNEAIHALHTHVRGLLDLLKHFSFIAHLYGLPPPVAHLITLDRVFCYLAGGLNNK